MLLTKNTQHNKTKQNALSSHTEDLNKLTLTLLLNEPKSKLATHMSGDPLYGEFHLNQTNGKSLDQVHRGSHEHKFL